MRLPTTLPAFVVLCFFGFMAPPVSADVLSIDGTLANVGGFDIGVMAGDTIEVDVDYDPSVAGSNGLFLNAINTIAIVFAQTSISLTASGQFIDSITLLDDNSGFLDQIIFSLDGVSGTTMLGGETVTTLSLVLQETEFPGPPDLLDSAVVLPIPPLDFNTTGTLALSIGISFTGIGNNFNATSVDPMQRIPEPAPALAAAMVLLALSGLHRRERSALLLGSRGRRSAC